VPGIEEPLDPLAHEQLAARRVPLHDRGAAAFLHSRQPLAQVLRQCLVVLGVGLELGAARVQVRVDTFHVCTPGPGRRRDLVQPRTYISAQSAFH
jgi:hypothetical protein